MAHFRLPRCPLHRNKFDLGFVKPLNGHKLYQSNRVSRSHGVKFLLGVHAKNWLMEFITPLKLTNSQVAANESSNVVECYVTVIMTDEVACTNITSFLSVTNANV